MLGTTDELVSGGDVKEHSGVADLNMHWGVADATCNRMDDSGSEVEVDRVVNSSVGPAASGVASSIESAVERLVVQYGEINTEVELLNGSCAAGTTPKASSGATCALLSGLGATTLSHVDCSVYKTNIATARLVDLRRTQINTYFVCKWLKPFLLIVSPILHECS